MYRHLEDDWYECDTCKARRRSPVDLAQVRCRCGARPEPEPDKKQPCGEPCGNRVVKLFETAWSFTKSITYWTARGFKTPTQEQYDERRAICHACPKLVKSLGMVERCGECKCVIALKAGLIQNPGQSDCPLGHWPAIGTPPEPAPDLEHTARIVRPLQTEKPVEDKSRKVLFRITKGLGDSMCFRSVLMHIKALRPDWTVDVQTHPYHASLFDRVRFDEPERGEYDTIHSAEFMRPKYCVFDAPSNTTQRFLLEVCRIKPQADLSGYGTLAPSDEELLAARRFLQRVSGEPLANGRYRVALIHPIGRSFQAHKNPPQSIWTPTIERVKRLGFVPVAIDIGAHCGFFSRLASQLWPSARIIAVEPVAENAAVARLNCPQATIIEAACTYDPEPIRLRVTIDQQEHTGGSHVAHDGERVVGDVILDRYIFASTTGRMAETDSPILRIDRTEDRLAAR